MTRARFALALALAFAAGAVLEGCVVLPILGGPPPREDDVPPVANLEGLADVRGLVHVHSLLSHDSKGTFEAIADAAVETSCSFVILCDHLKGQTATEEGPDGRVGGVLFLPGAELNMNGGSLLALGVRAGIDPRLLDAPLVAAIRARGGLAAIGHPESVRLEGLVDVDGCELENVHADTTDENKLTLGLRALFFPPRPFFSSVLDLQVRAGIVYDSFARERPLAAIGACDAHEAIRPLGPLAGAVDSYRRLFRTATTHVWVPLARTGETLAKADVLEAIRAGRTYAASELTRDATGFRFVARDAQGNAVALPGGAAPLAPGLALEVALPGPGTIVLLRDGADTLVLPEGDEAGAATARFVPVLPGAYRVLATTGDRPWIWSSAIRITTLPSRKGD